MAAAFVASGALLLRPLRSSSFSTPFRRESPRAPRLPQKAWTLRATQTKPPSTSTPSAQSSPSPPGLPAKRMFSNVESVADGSFQRKRASELGCGALVAGTMIGAGVLALPTVAAPAGFVPSSAALLGVWGYMVATGLLISGRPSGVSVLSLAELTLGKIGAVFSAASYTLLHYAILTAYTSQGGAMLVELFKDAENYTHFGETLNISSMLAGALFAGLIGGSMYALSARMVERINNVLVGAVLATFIGVVWAAGTHVDLGRLFGERHWDSLVHGQILSVLFVSCVYHNVVSSITMRLEGNREKIRRVIVGGTAVPVMMFLIYNAAILGSGGVSARNEVAVAVFSLLAVATSFVGFVEGLTDLWTDVRLSGLGESQERVTQTRYRNFLATLVPPVVFTALSPDVFLQALDAAGTYGIAVLFGGLPAAMAWKNRRRTETKEFGRMVGGGDWVLAAMGVVPILLIGNKVWEGLRHVV